MKLKKPKHINKGDTIAIAAPSSSFNIENFKNGVSVLEEMGFIVKYSESMFNESWSQPEFNQERGEQLNKMFADKDVKAILCAKGGYGTLEILPYLDKTIIRKNPKIFVGYSDISSLLLYLQNIAKFVVFHGPVVSGEMYKGMNPMTIDCMTRLLTTPLALGSVKFPKIKVLNPGKATGVLVGGNISVIIETLGTDYEIDTTDKILFLEDIGEESESINNFLTKLKQLGKLKNIKGLILGKMVGCFDEETDFKDIINKIFSEYNIPIISKFPSGHTRDREDLHMTLPFGISVTMDTEALSIIFNESAVS
ncbi:MAG: LD-carboxypeptidase [Elusimicrobiota bacterium]